MSELKPCPFCGAENTDVGFIAHTDDCYLMRRYIGASSRKELGIAWNIRPIEDELRAELEKRTAGLHYANAVCMEMKHELDRLNAERRWIPVSERLPEQNEVVLLWDRICSQQVLAQFHQFKRYAVWYIDGEDIHLDFSKDQFVSWMPLPPAPEREG